MNRRKWSATQRSAEQHDDQRVASRLRRLLVLAPLPAEALRDDVRDGGAELEGRPPAAGSQQDRRPEERADGADGDDQRQPNLRVGAVLDMERLQRHCAQQQDRELAQAPEADPEDRGSPVNSERALGPALLPSPGRVEVQHVGADIAAGIMGANISPYMLYFYSSGAREEGWSERSLGVDRATAILGIGLGGLGQLAILLLSAMALEPLHIQDSTHAEIGLPLVVAVGAVGAFLRAAILLTTCCWGTALELCTTIPYIIAQGLGWEWGKDKKPAEAARYSLVVVLFRRSLGG